MNNITTELARMEIRGVNKIKKKDLLAEINSYLPIIQKIGSNEEVIDNLVRAVMQNNEDEIYLNLSEILYHRMSMSYDLVNVRLEQDEKDKLARLVNLLWPYINHVTYIWSIEQQLKLVDAIEDDSSFLDLEDQYYAEQFERYEDLEEDGYSTD